MPSMPRLARQVSVFLAGLLATFALLAAVTSLIRFTRVLVPTRAAIARLPGVRSVATTSLPDGSTVVRVRLGRVADFMSLLAEIRGEIPPALGPYRLVVLDRPDPRLEGQLRTDAFAVEQGLATGQFVAMRRELLAMGRSAHIRTAVEIDADAVYLSLYDGDHYVYQVFQKGGLSR
jgi:hypothetical protein